MIVDISKQITPWKIFAFDKMLSYILTNSLIHNQNIFIKKKYFLRIDVLTLIVTSTRNKKKPEQLFFINLEGFILIVTPKFLLSVNHRV